MAIAFTKVKLPFGWLGNMAPFPVEFDGKTWLTTEALFQALRFPKDRQDIWELIREQKSPMQAKLVAKARTSEMSVQPKSPLDVGNMVFVVHAKLEQHPHLKTELLATGDELIVEDITKRAKGGNHDFWGAALVDGQWVGQNTLGRIWMDARKALRESPQD